MQPSIHLFHESQHHELEATIDELDGWMGELNDHFESMDPGGEGRTPTEEESGIPDSQRSVIHNRRPDW